MLLNLAKQFRNCNQQVGGNYYTCYYLLEIVLINDLVANYKIFFFSV